MSILDTILTEAKKAPQTIVFPEGDDERIVEAALKIKRDGIACPILLGDIESVETLLKRFGGNDGEITIIDPLKADNREDYASTFFELRKHKGISLEQAADAVKNRMVFANLMVKRGEAGGTVGGAVASTADTVRVALQIIGSASGVKTVSSFFLIILDQPHHTKKKAFVFSDCALVVDPDTDQLAEIAVSSATSFQAITKEEPRIAMLSFSTKGSAKHERVSRIDEATKKIKAEHPSLHIDGDLQFDTAFVKEIAEKKSPGSDLQGDANVMIFPSLEAGNIGYKIAQRIGGAKAIGPILQGLDKPANDLSRGCSVDDIYYLAAITSLQAGMIS